MGIVNATPDSFSDGGRFLDAGPAVDHALALVEAGADIIDVGGESSRPGAEPVPAEAESDRVLPVIEGVRAHDPDVVISVDTTKAAVAEAALDAGADIVNDITGLSGEPALRALVGRRGVGCCLMHMRGTPQTMQRGDLSADDIVAFVRDALRGKMDAARAAGVQWERICVDPGVGFGKTVAQNLELIRRLDAFASLERPVLVGVSRKSFLGAVSGRAVDARAFATESAHACAVMSGAHILRVHDVAAARDAAHVATAIRDGWGG
jgi:dihydropteroate synthase